MLRFKKTFVAQLLLVMIISHTMIVSHENVARAEYVSGYNPGMQLRLEQASVNSFKRAMAAFFPHYLNVDLQMPKEYHYTVAMFLDFLSWKIDWTDIQYDSADLDINDVHVDFTRFYDRALLKVKCPAVKEWKISAHQSVNTWILPGKSKVELEFKDFSFDYQVDLKLTEQGFLKPIVYDVDIKFGDSYFYHDDWFIAFIMH